MAARAQRPKKRARGASGDRRDAGRPRGVPIMDAVLTRTLEELVAHGIEGANVERIARAAEVNKTSVYRRWPTKEALVAAALERVAVDIGAQLEDRGSLTADLEHLAERVAALLETPLGRSLARAAMAESVGAELSALAAREVDRPRASAALLHARARARRELRADVAPDTLLATLVGALLHRTLLQRSKVTPGFIRELVALVVRGVRPD